MEIQALGLIEVKGFLGAIAAADAALKTASVQLINAEKISGGLTTIQVSGDVAAVSVAVDAGSAVARELNCLKSSHVIPRLASETAQMVLDSIGKTTTEPVAEPKVEVEKAVKTETIAEASPTNTVSVKKTKETISSGAAPEKKVTKPVTIAPEVAPKKKATTPKKVDTPTNKKKK